MEIDGTYSNIECPEVIQFEQNGEYEILNDCYGDDPRYPIVEKGKWLFSCTTLKVVLFSRNIIEDYGFQKENNFVVLTAKSNEKTNLLSYLRSSLDKREAFIFKEGQLKTTKVK